VLWSHAVSESEALRWCWNVRDAVGYRENFNFRFKGAVSSCSFNICRDFIPNSWGGNSSVAKGCYSTLQGSQFHWNWIQWMTSTCWYVWRHSISLVFPAFSKPLTCSKIMWIRAA